MSRREREYPAAFNRAVERANLLGREVGLSWSQYGGWSDFSIPRPENRSGHELRCQVVTPGSPPMVIP